MFKTPLLTKYFVKLFRMIFSNKNEVWPGPISRLPVWQHRHKWMQSFAVCNLSEICLSGQSWGWWASLSRPLHYYKGPCHNYCWPLLFLVFSVIFHSIFLWNVGNWIALEEFMIVRFHNHGYSPNCTVKLFFSKITFPHKSHECTLKLLK